MKLSITTLLLLCAFTVFGQSENIYKRVKIDIKTKADFNKLAQEGIPLEHGIRKENHFIITELSQQELDLVKAAGFKTTIIDQDVKATFLAQNKRSMLPERRNPSCDAGDTQTYPTPANFNQGSMGGYFTYQEALAELDEMRSLYPNLITAPTNISDFLTEGTPDTSVSPSIGGNPIKWLKISDNPESDTEGEPQVLYTSIHHAREPMSLSQLIYYMWYLLENYEIDPEIKTIVDNTELYFVPVVNPDGYLYNQVTDPDGGGLWRKNRNNSNGVDNNRNYDYHINGDASNGSWGGPGSSNNPGSQTYHGTGPFSEIENQAIKWFVEQHDFVLALNNHTFGRLVYYPFGYDDVATPDDALYQTLGNALTAENGYALIRDAPFSGDSDDFMYGTVGTHDKIFAFTPEISTSFWPAASEIDPVSKEMMFLNLTAARLVSNYATIADTSPQLIENTTSAASFRLQRLGIGGNGDFTVRIVPVSENIASVADAQSFSGLSSSQTETGSITLTLESDTAQGDLVIYDLIVNNGAYDTTQRITKFFGSTTTVFSDNGDSVTANFENTSWGTTTSTFVSASSSITDSPSGNYANNSTSSLVLSEPIDLSNAIQASVRFYARWDIEDIWDYAQFEISTDNGTTWIPQCGKFTTSASNTQPAGEPLYDGRQTDWVLEEISLSDYLGETIRARFTLVTDNTMTLDGFYVDDLSFIKINDEDLGVNNAFAKAFSFYPNPVKNKLQIATSLANYQLSIVNLQGQIVTEQTTYNGNSTIDYSRFSSGVYFVNIVSQQGETATFKVVKR